MPPDIDAFSDSYSAARDRFRTSAESHATQLESHTFSDTGPAGETLTCDVARIGPDDAARLLVVSSGLHGAEGPFGSAVQVAAHRARLFDRLPADTSVLLLHALNPFGYAHGRRCDRENIDPNRNFLLPGEPYSGSPDGYVALDSLLNPPRPPLRFDPFPVRAAWALARHGMPRLKQAIAGGQHDFPKGLFFGGQGPGETHRLLEARLESWIGPARRILHLDFHTGLGRRATWKLLAEPELGPPRRAALEDHFGPGTIDGGDPRGVAYACRGSLGGWCHAKLADLDYTYLCAEFGTCVPLTVLAALRSENQSHHWGRPDAPIAARAKARLREVFCPASSAWRRTVLADSLALVRRGFDWLDT